MKCMNSQIEDYINKQKSPQKEICQNLRSLILKTLPQGKEEMKWGVPSFAGGRFYIVALRDHVNLGFYIKELVKDDIAFFEGNGKTMRHIRFSNVTDLDEDRIIRLLKLVDI
jgi:hypothetical protein